jgi:GT2 family glycosyltransferase
MARVDLIIPTYNGTDYLIACLRSLSFSSFTDFNLIVFDDGSDQPVHCDVHELYPDATVMRVEQNEGLTRAFNAAIDSSSAEFVVLLNNDTEVEEDWLAELVSCADRHPAAGSVASKLRLASDRNRLHSAGDTYSMRGMPGNRGVWLDDFGQYDIEGEIFSACAGAALYRRTALEAVRFPNGDIFDTQLFMYCEDVDLGWRLQCAEYRCVFAPRSVVYHHLSATGGGKLASYYVARNVWLVLAHSVPSSIRCRFWKRIAAHHVGRAFRTVRSIREPAARRSLIGTLHGIGAFVGSRKDSPYLAPAELDRVLGLLVDR